MTEWAQSTLRVRNAELFTNEEGDWVRASSIPMQILSLSYQWSCPS